MARALDQAKRREWAQRLERFRASGGTVAHFCAQERVRVSTFYYWAKRDVPVAPREQRHALGEGARPARVSNPAGKRHDGDGPAPAKAAVEEFVRFRFGRVEVDVPAGCLDVIRCLAESAARSGAHDARSTPGAFHQIVLGSRH